MWMSMIGCTKSRPYAWLVRCIVSVEPHVLKIERLAVDSPNRRRDPVCKLSRLNHPPDHQRLHKSVVLGAGQPFVFVLLPGLRRQHLARGADVVPGKISDGAVKSFMRQRELEGNPRLVDHPLPA